MPELKISDSLAILVGMWRSENISKMGKKPLAYFTSWHQKSEISVEGKYYPNLCCKSRMVVWSFFKSNARMQKHIQVSLNTIMFKDNKIKMLQICNYNPEPWHNGQKCELSLNLKPSATWKKFSADLGQLVMLCGSYWQSGGQSQVPHLNFTFAQKPNSLKIQRL